MGIQRDNTQFIVFEKSYVSVNTEVLYNNLIEFGIPMKLFRPTKTCLNVTCIKVL
jgi:hypothetical protein